MAYTGFLIPNLADAPYLYQARPASADIQILAAAFAGAGVVTGCAVTPQGSPNMTVAVASGTVQRARSLIAVTSGNVTIAAAAASPRIDCVSVDSAGAKIVTAGMPATEPMPPTIPQSGGINNVVLAFVYVAENTTGITAAMLTDKRAFVRAVVPARVTLTYGSSIVIDASLGAWYALTVTDANAFDFAAPTNPITGQMLTLTVRNGTGGVIATPTWNAVWKQAFTRPAAGTSYTYNFGFDGTNWVQLASSAQVPN